MLMPSIFGENLFDEWFDNSAERAFFNGRTPLYNRSEKPLMRTDVKEKDGWYEIDVDLPGFKKEDVTVQLDKGYLTISAVQNEQQEQKPEDGKKEGYIRRERWFGNCSRSFYVGDNIRSEDIKARMEDGILSLTIPKESRQIAQPNRILIEG
jgi:HSP20 family molecular chaperone IbpA